MPFFEPDDRSPVIPGEGSWWYPRKGEPGTVRPPEILLRGAGSATFQLMRGFVYKRPTRTTRIPVPAHVLADPPDGNNRTDFASVPSLFWWLVASYGHQTRAALIHDHLWENKDERVETNEIFRDALSESGVAVLRRWIMWAAVDAARRCSVGALAVVGVVLEVVTAIAFLLSAALAVQPWVWSAASWLWQLFTSLADRAPAPLKNAWHDISRIPLDDPRFTGFVALLGICIWQRHWALATFGLALVLPPLIPELISRRVLLWSEWPFYWCHKWRNQDNPAIPTPKPTVLPTRAFLRL